MTEPQVKETEIPGSGTSKDDTVALTGRNPFRRRHDRKRSLWSDAWRQLIRNPIFIVSALVVLAVISMAIAPWLWTDVDPRACNLAAHSKQGPTAGHPFGFTLQGCDMYANVIYGARPDIIIAVVVTLATLLIGGFVGTIAAFFGRWADAILSRLTDIVFGLPFILGAIVFLAVLDSHSIWAICLVLVILGWTQLMRIMRGSIMENLNRDYVRAARALGASNSRIIFRHLLPNSIAPLVVISTVGLGGYVSAEATLTFLGVGLRPPAISWGILISVGDQWALSGFWHLLIFPCAFLIVTVLAFILIGDALRDALDPKLR